MGHHFKLLITQVGDTYKLRLAGVTISDYGAYHCRASNLLVKGVTASIQLTG